MVVAPGEHRPPVPGGDLGAVLERLKGVDGHGVHAVKAQLLAEALLKSQKILKIKIETHHLKDFRYLTIIITILKTFDL